MKIPDSIIEQIIDFHDVAIEKEGELILGECVF